MQNSNIEWTHHTSNLWIGCEKVANNPGCDHCYAERQNNWLRKKLDLWGTPERLKTESWIPNLLTAQAKAEQNGQKQRVFVGSMMDVFEKDRLLIDKHGALTGQTTADLLQILFEGLIPACPNLIFLLLTKRPSLINKKIPPSWLAGGAPDNVMVGTSSANQATFDDGIRHLSKVNLPRFMSVEPQIAYIKPTQEQLKQLDWLIQGGESGPKRRPFMADWARSMRDACAQSATPYFFKQIDKVQPIPDDLMVRQFPKWHES